MLDQAAPRREQGGLFHIDLLTPRTDAGQGGSASPKTIGNREAQSNSQRVKDTRSMFFSERFSRGARIPLMNTPELLSKLNKSISQIARALRRFIELIFGNISWRPPAWLSRSVGECSRFGRAHPRLIASGMVAILLISWGGAWTWKWYSHLPKPRKISAKIVPIEVTKLEKELKFPRLVVYFSESAARLEDLKKPSVQGVRLDPNLNGSWHWAQADILVFEPSEDWPADQKFGVVFNKNFFPRHVLMERLAYETRTPPFAITVKDPEIYPDPTNSTTLDISGILRQTDAVDPCA